MGDGPRLVVLRAAGPEHLRPVAELMASLGPLAVCLRFSEVWEAAPGHGVLLALQPDDYAAANIARPLFREHRLRAVLLMSDDDYARARLGAPDLLDWASATIEAEPVVPGFVAEGVRLFSAHYPGFAWTDTAEAATHTLQRLHPGAEVKRAPTPRQYTDLVACLAADDHWCLVPVATEADALRLRLAVAEAGRVAPSAQGRRKGRLVAVGRAVPGWPTLDPHVATWAALRAAPPQPGADAVALDAEAVALGLNGPVDEGARLDALSGRAPAPQVRAVLVADDLRSLRRRRDQIARSALKHDATHALHHVAAAAERARKVPDLTEVSPRLASAALVTRLRLLGPDEEATRIAHALWWPDVALHWYRCDPARAADDPDLPRRPDAHALRSMIEALVEARAGDPEFGQFRAGAALTARVAHSASEIASQIGVDHPDHLIQSISMADAYLMEGWTEAAHRRLDEVLQALSDNPPRVLRDYGLRHRLAQSLFAAGRQREAAEVLVRALHDLKAAVEAHAPGASAISMQLLHRLMSALGEVERGQGNHLAGELHRRFADALKRARHEKIGDREVFAQLEQGAFALLGAPTRALPYLEEAHAALTAGAPGTEATRAAIEALQDKLRAHLDPPPDGA